MIHGKLSSGWVNFITTSTNDQAIDDGLDMGKSSPLMAEIFRFFELLSCLSMGISGSKNGGTLVPCVRPYFVRIFPYIGRIYGRYLQFRFLKCPLKRWLVATLAMTIIPPVNSQFFPRNLLVGDMGIVIYRYITIQYPIVQILYHTLLNGLPRKYQIISMVVILFFVLPQNNHCHIPIYDHPKLPIIQIFHPMNYPRNTIGIIINLFVHDYCYLTIIHYHHIYLIYLLTQILLSSSILESYSYTIITYHRNTVQIPQKYYRMDNFYDANPILCIAIEQPLPYTTQYHRHTIYHCQ